MSCAACTARLPVLGIPHATSRRAAADSGKGTLSRTATASCKAADASRDPPLRQLRLGELDESVCHSRVPLCARGQLD